jgi:hypothetical protein
VKPTISVKTIAASFRCSSDKAETAEKGEEKDKTLSRKLIQGSSDEGLDHSEVQNNLYEVVDSNPSVELG